MHEKKTVTLESEVVNNTVDIAGKITSEYDVQLSPSAIVKVIGYMQ